jgi:2-dehydropantoate 2-reductase
VIEGAIDLVIVFGKATQTAAIVDACAEVLQRTSYVATLQNGLGNIEEIQRHVPADVTLLGVTTLSAELLGPGKIQALGSGTTQLGPLTPAGAGGATRTVTALQDAGLPTDYTPLPLVKVWTKVAFNCALNALCTVARAPVGSLAKYDDIQPLVWSIADEVVAVAGATGVQVDPTVLAASFDEAFDDTGRGSAHHIPSMLQDLLAGRRTEIDHLNAAVVRLGGAYGVETPVNDTLAQLVRLAEATMSAGVTSLAMPV